MCIEGCWYLLPECKTLLQLIHSARLTLAVQPWSVVNTECNPLVCTVAVCLSPSQQTKITRAQTSERSRERQPVREKWGRGALYYYSCPGKRVEYPRLQDSGAYICNADSP